MSRHRPARRIVLVCLVLGLSAACSTHRARRAADARILDPAALYRRGIEELARGQYGRARTFLDRIQYAPEGRAALEPLVRLALADVAFYTRDAVSLIEARSKYLDFVTLYGDHPRAPYAQLQAGLCSLEQVNHPQRDQSQTTIAINDLQEVEHRFPASPYVRAARELIARAESNLVEHEFGVGRFYFKRKSYLAASERFRTILKHYPRCAQRDKVYYYLGWTLLLMNNEAEGRLYLGKLEEDFPGGKYAQEAKQLLERADGAKDGKKG